HDAAEDLERPFALRLALARQSDPDSLRDGPDGFGEAQLVVAHEEPEGVAARATPEAVEDAALRIDGEGGRLLGMEGTGSFPVLPGALQVHDLPDELHHGQPRPDLVEQLGAESGHSASEGGFAPLPNLPRRPGCAGMDGARAAPTTVRRGNLVVTRPSNM